MGSSFNELTGTWINGKDRFRLINPFTYHVGHLGSEDKITVPAGFTTDFASVPRFAWRIIGTPTSYDYRNAAVLHDYLYCISARTRKECDLIFLEAMEVCGASWWKRHAMYRAVRIGGQKSYDEPCDPLSGKD